MSIEPARSKGECIRESLESECFADAVMFLSRTFFCSRVIIAVVDAVERWERCLEVSASLALTFFRRHG